MGVVGHDSRSLSQRRTVTNTEIVRNTEYYALVGDPERGTVEAEG